MAPVQISRGCWKILAILLVLPGWLPLASAEVVDTFTKPTPDVDKPFELKWEWTNPEKTEWRWWLDQTSAEYQKRKVTCGTAGLANKLWGAGYRYGPKTWATDRGPITDFQEVSNPQELYEALLAWLGTYKNSDKYIAIGLIGQDSFGKRYLDSLKTWDKTKLKRYRNFSWLQKAGGMTNKDYDQAMKQFRDCQFVELGVGGHVVSVAGIRLTKDNDGNVTKREIMLHDSDSDQVDDSTPPPTIAGDDEWHSVVFQAGKWMIDFGTGGGGLKSVVSYKTFCPSSYKVAKGIGTTKNPSVSYDPSAKTLSFADGAINILDSLGGMSGGIAAEYAGDPLLEATISISDLTLREPEEEDPSIDYVYFPDDAEYGYGGYMFSGGEVAVKVGEETVLTAEFPFFRVLPDQPDNIADSFGVLTDIEINNTIGSDCLAAWAAQAAEPGAIMDVYVEIDGFGYMAEAFDDFQGTQFITREATYALAKNGNVPEPACAVLLLAMGMAGILGFLRCNSHASREAAPYGSKSLRN